jgi:acetyl-CoA acyltransferase 2
MATNLLIYGAKRTPFGAFGGKLKNLTATDLGAAAGSAALQSCGVDPTRVGSSVWGNVAQTSADAAYLARHVGLRCGLPHSSIALTVNRLCGSGFQALITAAHELGAGDNASGLALVGGAESMSQAPLSAYGHTVRFGTKLGADLALQDTLWAALTDAHCKTAMGTTAETLGAQYGVTRAACDAFALASQQRWAAAARSGAFAASVTPLQLPGRKGSEAFSADEHPRPDSTAEQLAKLAPVFKKEDGLVTAGNASGICDGAAALVVGAPGAAGAKPLARVLGWATAGVDPRVMGIGPAPAIRAVLGKLGLKLEQMDLVEVRAGGGGGGPRPPRARCLQPPPRTQHPSLPPSPPACAGERGLCGAGASSGKGPWRAPGAVEYARRRDCTGAPPGRQRRAHPGPPRPRAQRRRGQVRAGRGVHWWRAGHRGGAGARVKKRGALFYATLSFKKLFSFLFTST